MLKILIVEDNEDNLDILTRRLTSNGFDVFVAMAGAAGIVQAALKSPDLIIMDMSLPVLDGWEATRQLKSNPLTRSIPIIALTAHAMAGDREKALTAGSDD